MGVHDSGSRAKRSFVAFGDGFESIERRRDVAERIAERVVRRIMGKEPKTNDMGVSPLDAGDSKTDRTAPRAPIRVDFYQGGDTEAGTEGYDALSATAEPNTDCRNKAMQYRRECVFGTTPPDPNPS